MSSSQSKAADMIVEDDKKDEISVSNYGLKVRLNHTYPEDRSQDFMPSLRQIWTILPLILRYCKFEVPLVLHYIQTYRKVCRYGLFKNLKIETNIWYSVPIGGIGCGTIGRGYRGEFCRFQLKPGLYEYNTVDANQFIVTIKDGHHETIFHSLLSTFPKKSLKSWESFIDGSECFYTGLYPRSWTEYDLSKYGVMITCRQISPVIPNNYKDTSLPCAVFVWDIKNICDEDRTLHVAQKRLLLVIQKA
ncbi:GBA2 N domain containing protein [Asbolus verrucosus]|uniref:GBA2 N domain containing protein n=1 Tax=Asbolus verrucosus TaxID=1661398 RepID=A0A482VFQ7_ASBVE|nr:GBA2 N domain containing protein [Asbolus verrucosus]